MDTPIIPHAICVVCGNSKPYADFGFIAPPPAGWQITCRACLHVKNSPVYTQLERARSLGLPAKYTDKQWKACLNYFGNACAACNRSDCVLVMDHWIPLSNPGCPGTTVQNIIPLCAACNNSKRDLHALRWLNWRFGENRAEQILSKVLDYFQRVNT